MSLKRKLATFSLIGATVLSPASQLFAKTQSAPKETNITHNIKADFENLYSQLILQKKQTPEENKNLRYLFQEFYHMHKGPERIQTLIQSKCHVGYVDKFGYNDSPEPSGGYLTQSKGLKGTSYELILNPKKSIAKQLSTLVHETIHLEQYLHEEKIIQNQKLSPLAFSAKTLASEMDADVSSIETIYKQKEKYPETWKAFNEDLPNAKIAYEEAKEKGLDDDTAYTLACKASLKDYDILQKKLFGYGIQQALLHGYEAYQNKETNQVLDANQMMQIISRGRYKSLFEEDIKEYKPTIEQLNKLNNKNNLNLIMQKLHMNSK